MGQQTKFLTDTRVTGLFYLGLALTGFFVFLFARSNIYVESDALATSTKLIEKEALARLGIAVELALVVFQALAAIWFYKLFKRVRSFEAGLITVFGMVNAAAILISAAMWLSALNLALSGATAEAYNLLHLHESIWLVSGIFFGLWLIPMGYLAAKSNMPRALAGFLITGGVGYILSTLLIILFTGQKTLSDLLILPATVGEIWMVGYLISKPELNTTSDKSIGN
jgi:Domain of unknown function (DUF4386)